MSYYDSPPLRPSATFYPYEPNYHQSSRYDADPYTDSSYPESRGRRRSPLRSSNIGPGIFSVSPTRRTGSPRIFDVSPTRRTFEERRAYDNDRYEHSPTRSRSRSRSRFRFRSPSPSPFRSRTLSRSPSPFPTWPRKWSWAERVASRARQEKDANQYEGIKKREGGSYFNSHIPASRSEPPRPPTPPPKDTYPEAPRPEPEPTPKPTPPPRSSTDLPHDPVIDTSACVYTYGDEEPATIPIQPAAWNKHASSATREELVKYFIKQGVHPARAVAEVDREFSAQAPQYVAGKGQGPSRAEQRKRAEKERDRSPGPDPKRQPRRSQTEGQSSRGTRHHSPPPSSYRSKPSRHRSSSSSSTSGHYGSSSPKESDGERKYRSTREKESRRERERESESREKREREERRDRKDREDAKRERRYRDWR